MGWTEERAALYEFTSAYYLRDLCLTVKADGPFADITKLSDFSGRGAKAITQMGTAWVDNLSQIPDMVAAANYETTAECFMAIATGVADVCMVDLPTSLSAAMTNSNLKILELDPNDNLDSSRQNKVCIAFKKGNTQLRDTVQGAMDKLDWNADKMNELMEKAIKLQPSVE
jgi:putative lysine transport system substrate-binding protein